MTQPLNIQTLEQWVGENEHSIAFALLALRYLEQGNGEKACQIVEKGLAQYPNYPFGHFVAGLCYYNKKDLTEAKNHLDISVTYDPVNPRAWQLLAEINRKLELNLLAEDCQLRLTGIDGFSPDVESVASLTESTSPVTETAAEGPETAGEEEIPELLEDIPDLETAASMAEEELNLEELFEESEAEAAESADVDEIFKEAVGDLSTAEEAPEAASEEAPKPEQPAEEEKTSATADTGDDFSNAMENFFSSLEEGEGKGEEPSETGQPEAEQATAAEPSGDDNPDDLFDFSQAVEEFLSEREEEIQSSEAPEEAPPAPKETTPSSVRDESAAEDESEFIIDLDESEAESPSDEEVSKPPILSPTLGEIYISQGRFQEAIHVFEQLLQQDPDNPHFKRKIREIQNLIDKQKNLEA